jgi:hypothetical protein
VQTRADVHDTAAKVLSPLWRGFGVRWMTHFAPFHRSIVLKPTAVHALAVAQDTPASWSIRTLAFAACITDQDGAVAAAAGAAPSPSVPSAITRHATRQQPPQQLSRP